jgi:D-xylonolactonase
MQPELIVDYKNICGENPLWHPLENKLYWVDIPKGRIFRYEPSSGKHEMCYEDIPVGGFTIQKDGSLLLFRTKGEVVLWKNGKITKTVIKEIPEEKENRFNDVIADPAGRVFCGTFSEQRKPGRLYRLDVDGSITKLLDNVGCSNGLGFTMDRKKMYYTDSRPAQSIYIFDYDQESGAVSNQRVFVKIPATEEGHPDGMTVDAEGYIWSASWDGWSLFRYYPDGRMERRVRFPAKKVSSIIFGGSDLTDMYVTTAGGDNKAENGTGAGALFRLNLGIKGIPEFFSQIRI